MIVRETIYAALWELGASAAQFTSTNRRLRHWADVAAAEQPALFMSEKGGQAAIKKLGAPIVWTLYAEFYVYAHSNDFYLAPAAILNPARCSRSRARTVTDDWDPKPWAPSNGSARLYRRQASD
jgi:hypothetical protein